MRDRKEENKKERRTEKTDEFEVTDNNHVKKMTELNSTEASDKYTGSIDLSNACRQFYHSRKRAAEVVKEKLASSGRQRTTKKKTSIDVAMETLRNEMTGLMDQDLSLMEQLLTLNEAIEDIKWQRNYYSSQSSMAASSCDLNESDWSVSETDMYRSKSDDLDKQTTVTSVTTQSDAITRLDDRTTDDRERDLTVSPKTQTFVVSNETRNYLGLPVGFDFSLNGKPHYCHEKLNYFNFRADGHVLRKQITV